MIAARLISPGELSGRERAYWRALQAGRPEFRSPLMGPDFAALVGAVRRDAAVLILTRAGVPVGFLPHHRRPFGVGRPIGSPFSDLHGLVSQEGLGLDEGALLALAGLRAFHFSGLVDPFAVFVEATAGHEESWFVSGDGAFERLRAARKAHFGKAQRRERKLEALVGKVEVTLFDRRPQALDRAFGWKRDQLRASGLHDFLRPAWTRELMRRVFESPFGLLLTLNVAGQPIAGRFGMIGGGVCHPWITAYDPALAYYSPGNILLWKFLEAMPALGLHTYDMGPGHDHDKTHYATGSVSLGVGTARLGRRPWLAPPDFVRRRLRQIAEVELDGPGRALGLVTAIVSQARRAAARLGASGVDGTGAFTAVRSARRAPP